MRIVSVIGIGVAALALHGCGKKAAAVPGGAGRPVMLSTGISGGSKGSNPPPSGDRDDDSGPPPPPGGQGLTPDGPPNHPRMAIALRAEVPGLRMRYRRLLRDRLVERGFESRVARRMEFDFSNLLFEELQKLDGDGNIDPAVVAVLVASPASVRLAYINLVREALAIPGARFADIIANKYEEIPEDVVVA